MLLVCTSVWEMWLMPRTSSNGARIKLALELRRVKEKTGNKIHTVHKEDL